MKKKLLLSLLISLSAFYSKGQAPSKCACNGACTQTINAPTSTPIVVNAGQFLCITKTGKVNGTIDIKRNGTVCNSGEIYGDITMDDYSTLKNEGYINTNIFSKGYSNISNCSNMIVKNSPPDHIKGPGMVNYGCSHYKKDVFWSNIFQIDTIWGKTFIDGDLEITYRQVVVVAGYLEVSGTLIVSSDARLAIPPGSCVKAGDVLLMGNGIINGPGPGYGQIMVEGTFTDYTNTGIVSLNDMLDVCVKKKPGLPDNSIADPTVTFCVNNTNCTFTRCDSIQVSCAISASAVPLHPTCSSGPNGQITVTAAGGTPPYTYSWSNGQTTATITGVAPGTYTVTVSYAGGGACTAKAVATVNPPPICNCAINVTGVPTHPYCKDHPYGSITVSPSGGTSPYTYSWSSGQTTATITGLKAGTYTVTVSDATGACVTTKSFYINPSAISPLLIKSNDTLYALPKQSGNTNLYRWFLNGNLITGAGLDYYVVTQPGAYSVNVTTDLSSENACTGVSNVIQVITTSMFPEKENEFFIRVVPNPNKGVFSIHFVTGKLTVMDIEIYDIMGKQIIKEKRSVNLQDKMDLDLSPYGQGLYFLNVKDTQGTRSVTKIVSQ